MATACENNPVEYRKELKYIKYLPYYAEIAREADDNLSAIKSGIGRAILGREIRPGLLDWASELRR